MAEKLVDAPDWFEKEFGGLDPKKRERMVTLLREFYRKVCALADENRGLIEQYSPEHHTCSTCAFTRADDSWQGFVATTYGIVWALVNDKFFVCHRNQPREQQNVVDLSKAIPCTGWILVKCFHLDEARTLALATRDAMLKIAEED